MADCPDCGLPIAADRKTRGSHVDPMQCAARFSPHYELQCKRVAVAVLRARIAELTRPAATQSVEAWIACSERMPEDEERVLFAYRSRDGIRVVDAFPKMDFAATHRWQFSGGQYCGVVDAIAWQSFSALP